MNVPLKALNDNCKREDWYSKLLGLCTVFMNELNYLTWADKDVYYLHENCKF